MKKQRYDVLVVGAGHAGCEAALASSRLGCATLLITGNLDTIGTMSCNPAIGGLGKGQLVKEIDALGGEMAKAADFSAIQFRMLNSSRGPAVRSTRAQIDRLLYKKYMRDSLNNQKNLSLKQAMVEDLVVKGRKIYSVVTDIGEEFLSNAVILCPGTFLNGLIHIGLIHYPGGRLADAASGGLSKSLKRIGFTLGRLKTGTTPRLNKDTIDFSKTLVQLPDKNPMPFSFSTEKVYRSQIPCFITYTNAKTHKIIRENLNRSPLYTGVIKSTGVRYCPSIEDKVVKFSDKGRHQIFLEPEGIDSKEIYPNGISTSLPIDVQLKMLGTIEGLERAEIIRPGYGIEYDFVPPTQLRPTLQTRLINGLFLAGQINGTTGYEEAAAQGLVAGINAASGVKGKEPFILGRDQAYTGVLIDDLVTKGTTEPYRMFTSRVEYRLLLREDNADIRLKEFGYSIGLINRENYKKLLAKKENIKNAIRTLKKKVIKPSNDINKKLLKFKTTPLKEATTLESLLKRPGVDYGVITTLCKDSYNGLSKDEILEVEIEVKYEGFIRRSLSEVGRFRNLENIKIPLDLEYKKIPGLSKEVQEKLDRFRPLSLGQALRISGITPAAISVLMIWLRKCKMQK